MACASCAAQVLRASFSEAVLPRSAFQRHFSADTRAWRTPALQRWRTAPSTRRLNTSAARSPVPTGSDAYASADQHQQDTTVSRDKTGWPRTSRARDPDGEEDSEPEIKLHGPLYEKADRATGDKRGTAQYGQGSSRSALSEPLRQNDTTSESYFTELTPESIDALAAESQANPNAHISNSTVFEYDPNEDTKAQSLQRTRRPQHSRSPATTSSQPSYSSTQRLGRSSSSNDAKSNTDSTPASAPRGINPDQPEWGIQKEALRAKFGPTEAWQPRKRLSPDAVEGIRALHAQYPAQFTTPVLADRFKVSPEAIRRILKSKWRPNEEEDDDRRKRWNQRGEKIWTKLGELGVKPPRKWREAGVGRRRDDGPERRPRYPWTGPSDDADERGASRGRVGGRGREVDLDGEDLGDRIV